MAFKKEVDVYKRQVLMTLNETNNVITYEYEQFYD